MHRKSHNKTGGTAVLLLCCGLVLQSCLSIGSVVRSGGELPEPEPQQALYYYESFNRLNAGAPASQIDWYAMRMAFATTNIFPQTLELELGVVAEIQKILGLNNSGNSGTAGASGSQEDRFNQCQELSQVLLHANYTSLLGHSYARYCKAALQQFVEASHHQSAIEQILFSLFASGDGTSEQQAIHIISSSELFGFFQAMGWDLRKIQLASEEDGLFQVAYVDFGSTEQQEELLWVRVQQSSLKQFSELNLREE